MSSPRISHLVSKSIVLFAAQSLSTVLAIVTTPVVAIGLGPEHYGLYALIFGLLSYSSILDMGLSFSVVKQVSERDATRDRVAIEELLGTAATVYAVIASVLMLVLVAGRDWLARSLLNVPEPLVPSAAVSLTILACTIPVTTLITLFNATLRGLLRFEYVTAFSVATTATFSIGAAVLVRRGAGLVAIFTLYLVLTTVSALAHWIVVRRAVPGLQLRFRLQRSHLRRLFGFGRFMLINQLSMLALLHLDKLLIARLLSVAMIGYYTVPFYLSQRLNTLGAAVATVAFPFSSARLARGETEEFRRDYFQAARMLGWLTMVPALTAIIFADQILQYWMNETFALYGAWPLRLLALGMWVVSVASLDAVSIEGSGRPGVTSTFMAAMGITNIVGILTFGSMFGLVGIAGSVMFAHVALASLDVWFCQRYVLKLPLSRWGRAVALPTLLTVAVTAPLLIALRSIPSSLGGLAVVLIMSLAVTLAVGYGVFLAPSERKMVMVQAGRLVSSMRA